MKGQKRVRDKWMTVSTGKLARRMKRITQYSIASRLGWDGLLSSSLPDLL